MINNIERSIFLENLSLTQAYCHLQKDIKEKNNATIFRTFNPIFKSEPIFSFQTADYSYYKEPNSHSCAATKWAVDPFGETQGLIEWLFKMQIIFKERQIYVDQNQVYQGDILDSQIDCSVVDGASESQSSGLIDGYDLPPIDTWFYLTSNKETRLLFAWIPSDFTDYANEGILVNCVGCLRWFKEEYPELFKQVMTT